jgi:hypothetical protein
MNILLCTFLITLHTIRRYRAITSGGLGSLYIAQHMGVHGTAISQETLLVAQLLKRFLGSWSSMRKKKLRGLSPRANYTDRAIAACRRSDFQLFVDRGCHVVSVTDP